MAITFNQKYLWPPNFIEGTSVMGDNQRKITVRVTGVASDAIDGTDTAIDKSDLIGPAGAEPSSLVIEELEWSISGFDAVILAWDDGTDEEIARLSGAGFKDYTAWGGLTSDGTSQTGDLLVTTLGAATNASYDISVVARLKA